VASYKRVFFCKTKRVSQAALKFATVVEDSVAKFERVCAHHAARGQWLEVLHVLDQAPFNKVQGCRGFLVGFDLGIDPLWRL
jgi:hypothetical protein